MAHVFEEGNLTSKVQLVEVSEYRVHRLLGEKQDSVRWEGDANGEGFFLEVFTQILTVIWYTTVGGGGGMGWGGWFVLRLISKGPPSVTVREIK